MNAFAELASRKARQGASALLRDRDIVQSNYGRADALHRAARAFLIDAMSELMAASAEGGPRLINARAVFRAACTHAAESAVRIADMLAAETGAVAIFETSPIERFVRDIHAAVKHIAMSPNNVAGVRSVRLYDRHSARRARDQAHDRQTKPARAEIDRSKRP